MFLLVMLLSLLLQLASAQTPLKPQSNTFNSSYKLTPEQISLANLTQGDADNIAVAINFERSNWATGSVHKDAFYSSLPSNASNAPAGSLLKLEPSVNTSTYTLTSSVALSRLVFQSEDLNGSLVPSSAYILWPYAARSYPTLIGSVPLVAWAHGDFGPFAECAPSHVRNLQYQFSAPYALALQGYAVLGVDFSGLGVSKQPDGTPIEFQSLTFPAVANDIFYGVEAAKATFSQLSKEFVVFGHSLGAGGAWGAAQRQAIKPVSGYLGAIAAAPGTNLTAMAPTSVAGLYLGLLAARSTKTVFPSFDISNVLTEAGKNYLALASELQVCGSSLNVLLGIAKGSPSVDLLQPDWASDPTVKAWQSLAVAGGQNISGPLLILQGTLDPAAPPAVTKEFANLTCQSFPEVDLEFVSLEGVNHVPSLSAGQQLWLERIDALFAKDRSPTKGCKWTSAGLDTPRPLADYTGSFNFFLEYALNPYEIS